ncbi:helix-turn-helix transcriptional regulator [Streptantibioticus silvisoli]|uniref:AAA family ATPase n=1 Tax=Streptantibioticus silvisoli TaxID=2705255 RepID=A0ABT6W8N0_9ACTN|nr:LuxR family transcriptional regulator [Streptantibioticus silvisoli]MDI5967100.1 AAA family ATPase [Streptantibioticus silvisoli]
MRGPGAPTARETPGGGSAAQGPATPDVPGPPEDPRPPAARQDPRPPHGAPPGREREWAAAGLALAEGTGVLLTGPHGSGKSVLLAAVADAWAAGGRTVLRCAPAPEDAALPHLGLIDLLAAVPDAVLDGLPDGCRPALRAALLHGPRPAGGHDALAVRVAFLEVLRRLALRRPVLVVVDGLQWLDRPTADLLAFAVRRLAGTGVRVAAAERVADGGTPEGRPCCPPGTAEIALPPLGDDDVDRLLAGAVPDLPDPARRAVRRTAAGNPLYALELARATLRDGTAAPPAGAREQWWEHDGPDRAFGARVAVPAALRGQLLAGVARLSAGDRQALLLCAAADRPALALLRAAGLHRPAARLAAAERLGVLVTDPSGAVRFRHPVLRAALYAEADGPQLRRAHAALAGAVAEPVERSRHLALAHPHEDEATADALTSAAEAERGRGAPDRAARLAALAARRTPADRTADRGERWIAAAEYARDAGLLGAAERIARGVLARSGSARQRVRARLVLLGTAGQALGGARELIADGLRDARGVPELEAWLHHWAAIRGLLAGELEAAARHAGFAARRAATAGDTRAWSEALATLARVRSLTGEPGRAQAALDRAIALVGGVRGGPDAWAPARMRAVLALDADQVDVARERAGQLLETVGASGSVEETLATLVVLTRVQVRAGDCGTALRTAEECGRLAGRLGGQSPPALYAAALAAAFGGAPGEGRRLAGLAVDACEAAGDRLFLPRALAVLGQSALLAGDPPGAAVAAEALRRVKEIGDGMRAADPPMLHWCADLAEALVMLGEPDTAAGVVREAYERAGGSAPGSVLAALERAEGLCEAAAGRAKEGAARLRSSADRLRDPSLPLDLARSLIALGAVERRARHRPAAREALTEALRIAREAGAAPLAARAGEELERLDAGERGGTPLLTPTEARIAGLVGGGATNREVAAELFISVKTVEGTLSRVYRKFGVRSRTALARALTTASS